MHSVIFEIVRTPEEIGVSEDEFNDKDGEYLYDYVNNLDEEEKQEVMTRIHKYMGYPEEDLDIKKEGEYTKIRFRNLDKFFQGGFNALKELVNNMTLDTFMEYDIIGDIDRILKDNAPLVYDGYTQAFDEWLRRVPRVDGTYDSEWLYLGNIFDFHV